MASAFFPFLHFVAVLGITVACLRLVLRPAMVLCTACMARGIGL